MASVRLFAHFKPPRDWEVIQDEPVYSIIAILGSLGGLWTTFNGASAVLFGGGILLVFGDAQPFSVKH
jgi:hypothetical protein